MTVFARLLDAIYGLPSPKPKPIPTPKSYPPPSTAEIKVREVWQVKQAGDITTLDMLLHDGWQPFAVTGKSDRERIWLRRRQPVANGPESRA